MAFVLAGAVAIAVLPDAAAQALAGDYLNRSYDFRLGGGGSGTGPAPPPLSGAAISVPRVAGRLTAKEIGLVINTLDPYSVEVGAFYAKSRRLDAHQVLRIQMPVRPTLDASEFRQVQRAIAEFFGAGTQALALAWKTPYAVECNSITGALALGLDAGLCAHTCAASTPSPYFNARTFRPRTDLGLRPSMLLAAPDAGSAEAMIRRGVASDGSLGLRGSPPVSAYFLRTSDAARSVRAPLFPPPGKIARFNVDVKVERADALENVERVLIYETGQVHVPHLETIGWVPGALADHLTSFGGVLDGSGQMPATDWIGAGATASYGTVSEPCSHPQKFPHPQVLLLNYLQGATAIEAYWKSVAWPQQGVFIGEPLAAPFARR